MLKKEEHTTSYYGIEADFWFRLWDLRRLEAADAPGAIEALGRPQNTHFPARKPI